MWLWIPSLGMQTCQHLWAASVDGFAIIGPIINATADLGKELSLKET